MMIFIARLFVGRVLLLNPGMSNIMTFKRGVRSVRRIFRTDLPKYKIDINKLPPLTKLLTSNDEPLGYQGFIELRREKLEVYKHYLPSDSNTNLLEALFDKATDLDHLLSIIRDNLHTMTSFYLALSFEALDDMMRAGLCQPSTVAVAPEFKHLCKRTLYKLRFFESDEVLKLLKCLSNLGVPEDVLVVQAGLQMAGNLINDFNIDELNTLADAINGFIRTENSRKSLLHSLKVIIPIAQQKQIDGKQFTSLPSDAISLKDK